MGKIKTGFLAVTGAAVGIVTFRKLRKRRSRGTTEEADVSEQVTEAKEEIEDTGEEIEDAKGEAITAVKHAAGAVKHTGLAVGKAVRNRRQTVAPVDTDAEPVEPTKHSE